MTDVDAGAGSVQPTEGEPVAPTGLPPTPLEVLELSPEEWRIVAVAAVEMDLPSANPEIVPPRGPGPLARAPHPRGPGRRHRHRLCLPSASTRHDRSPTSS